MLRSEWLVAGRGLWAVGGWLTLLAIFSWMVLLITLMYNYSPLHRITTSLQTGLMLIGATLLITATVIWMAMLPQALDSSWARFVDDLVMALAGAGFFMSGGVTAWIALDLAQLEKLPWSWMAPGIAAGLLAASSPFLLPSTFLLIPALVLFIVWGLILGIRRTLPAAYPEMSKDLLPAP